MGEQESEIKTIAAEHSSITKSSEELLSSSCDIISGSSFDGRLLREVLFPDEDNDDDDDFVVAVDSVELSILLLIIIIIHNSMWQWWSWVIKP